MDSEIRSGLLKNDNNFFDDLEIIPGSAFVGCVQWKGERVVNTHMKERVASFCPQGGANSEFVKTEDASLVPVPEKVSSLCAAICVGAYLPVFQALNIGLPREHRYNSEAKSLHGKSVVYFTDPTSSFVEPLVRLAKYLGARDVYIPLGAESSEITAHLNSIGAIPFNPESKSFESGIDILMNDASIPITETIRSALTDTGFIVTIQKTNKKQHESSSAFQYHYNVADSWNSNLEESKKDLIFLFDLVKKKYLLPKLARTLRLSEVSEGHACLDAKVPIRGTFICLPWHKGF
jgi:NADPH:quinone reductase-like Zn-dependent oxidoreductase